MTLRLTKPIKILKLELTKNNQLNSTQNSIRLLLKDSVLKLNSTLQKLFKVPTMLKWFRIKMKIFKLRKKKSAHKIKCLVLLTRRKKKVRRMNTCYKKIKIYKNNSMLKAANLEMIKLQRSIYKVNLNKKRIWKIMFLEAILQNSCYC